MCKKLPYTRQSQAHAVSAAECRPSLTDEELEDEINRNGVYMSMITVLWRYKDDTTWHTWRGQVVHSTFVDSDGLLGRYLQYLHSHKTRMPRTSHTGHPAPPLT